MSTVTNQEENTQAAQESAVAHLLAIDGPARGTIWDVNQPHMVFGRAKECEIRIIDPTVSRRHCELHIDGDTITLSDFGGLNPVRVNGVACGQAVLSAGDRILLGKTSLLVTTPREHAERDSQSRSNRPSTLHLAQSSYAIENVETLMRQGDLSAMSDIASVYVFTRNLAACETLDEALRFFESAVRQRFQPDSFWYVRATGGDGGGVPTIARGDSDLTEFPVNTIRRATELKYGILESLLPDDATESITENTMVLVAPIVFANDVVGCVAVTSNDSFVEKDLDYLVALAISAAPTLRALEELHRLRQEVERLANRAGTESFVGNHGSVSSVRQEAIRAARGEMNVLVRGETGTGKELIARMIHTHSERSGTPFITLNCASIPDDLFESELFGYEKGAFTGATQSQPGLVEVADGGTLFLDEIGDMRRPAQAAILRLLETGTFYRLGSREQRTVDVRFVAATNKDLAQAVIDGEFRSDLYHRIAAFEIHIAPLRERLADVPLLVEHFLVVLSGSERSRDELISNDAVAYLASQSWPGNVRELRNAVEKAVLTADGLQIDLAHLQRPDNRETPTPPSATVGTESASLEDMERAHIANILNACDWNLAEAVRILKISRSTLYNKIAKYRLER